MRECVSVIMPAYNAEKTIEQAVLSALGQKEVLELLVIDDCSTDRTGEIIRSLASDPRVCCRRNSRRLGAAASRNRGVREARGEYVAFLDADDLWAEGKLARQLARLSQGNCVLSCTARELISAEGRRTGRVIGVDSVITYRRLLQGNQISCSSVVLPRELALQYPMEHEDSHEDYITWLKLLRERGNAAGIDEPLLLYRLGAGGKSGTKYRSAVMTYRAYRYAGLSVPKAAACFICYAFNGARKYAFSGAGRRKKSSPHTFL